MYKTKYLCYLVGEHIDDHISEVDDLLLVGAERGAPEPRGPDMQRAYPPPANHRAMHSSLHCTVNTKLTNTNGAQVPGSRSRQRVSKVDSGAGGVLPLYAVQST